MWNLYLHNLDAILSPVKTLRSILESFNYPTSNRAKPYIGKMIDRLDSNEQTLTNFMGKKEVKGVYPTLSIHCFCDYIKFI